MLDYCCTSCIVFCRGGLKQSLRCLILGCGKESTRKKSPGIGVCRNKVKNNGSNLRNYKSLKSFRDKTRIKRSFTDMFERKR